MSRVAARLCCASRVPRSRSCFGRGASGARVWLCGALLLGACLSTVLARLARRGWWARARAYLWWGGRVALRVDVVACRFSGCVGLGLALRALRVWLFEFSFCVVRAACYGVRGTARAWCIHVHKCAIKNPSGSPALSGGDVGGGVGGGSDGARSRCSWPCVAPNGGGMWWACRR